MTHELIADEGKWLYHEKPLEEQISFCKRALTSEPEKYHEVLDAWKVGYELLWNIRQVEHTEEELIELEEQYNAWKIANPNLVEDVEAHVPVKPEPDTDEPSTTEETVLEAE